MAEKKAVRSAKAPLKDKAAAAPTIKKPTATKLRSRAVARQPAFRGGQDDLHERVQRRAYEL